MKAQNCEANKIYERGKLHLHEQQLLSLQLTKYLVQYAGFPQGLTFGTQQRQILIKQDKTQHKWSQKHSWNRQKQLKKCQNLISFSLSQSEKTLNQSEFVEIFVEVGSILSEEFTEQIYIIGGEILKSIASTNPINFETIWNKIKFLNRKYPFPLIKACIVKVQNPENMKKMFDEFLKAWYQVIQKIWKGSKLGKNKM